MKEILYNILVEYEVPIKLIRLLKMCLNEAYNRLLTGKHMDDSFPIQNGLE
jgi:hypothetical protein